MIKASMLDVDASDCTSRSICNYSFGIHTDHDNHDYGLLVWLGSTANHDF